MWTRRYIGSWWGSCMPHAWMCLASCRFRCFGLAVCIIRTEHGQSMHAKNGANINANLRMCFCCAFCCAFYLRVRYTRVFLHDTCFQNAWMNMNVIHLDECFHGYMHAEIKRMAFGTAGCSLLSAPLFFTFAALVWLQVVLVTAGGGGGGNHGFGITAGFGGGGGGRRRGGVRGRVGGRGGQGLSNRATAISTSMCG